MARGEATFRFRLSPWLLKGSLVLFVVGNLTLLLAAIGWRLTRNRFFL